MPPLFLIPVHPQKGKDQDDKNEDKSQGKRLKKGQWGRPAKPKNDKKGNNNKNNNDKMPKKLVVIKMEKSKNSNVTTTPATPAFTRQRARTRKSNDNDTVLTNEIDSRENVVADDTFLEELFNTSMGSLE